MNYVKEKAIKNDPESVLKIIDECGYNKFFLMNIGDHKGKILDDYVLESKAQKALELGVYLGYSTIRIARNLSKNSHLYSIDANKDFLKKLFITKPIIYCKFFTLKFKNYYTFIYLY